MRRVVEITLVVAALVAVPLAVAVAARSERSPNAAPAALTAARRILGSASIGGARITLTACRWSRDGSRISCSANGPGTGTCTFTARGDGTCSGSSGDSFWMLQMGAPTTR